MKNKFGSDDETVEPIGETQSLEHVPRDEKGILRAATFSTTVCGCCGRMRLLMLDEKRQVFAWMGISPDQARGLSAALVAQAVESDQLGGGHHHAH